MPQARATLPPLTAAPAHADNLMQCYYGTRMENDRTSNESHLVVVLQAAANHQVLRFPWAVVEALQACGADLLHHVPVRANLHAAAVLRRLQEEDKGIRV